MFKIFKTKTFWINFVAVVVYFVNDAVLSKMVPPEVLAALTFAANVANRFLTTKPVSEK